MKNKELTKDELKKAITVMKDVLGIAHDTRLLSSKIECRKAIKEIADKYTNKANIPICFKGGKIPGDIKPSPWGITHTEEMGEHFKLYSENKFLKTQIIELKNKNSRLINENLHLEHRVLELEKQNKKWWEFWK